MNNNIYIFLGPSGSGKTTLGQYLQTLDIPEIISHTTRLPRRNNQNELVEFNGVHYYFVDEEEFDNTEMIEKVPYAGNFYGTSIKEVESKLHAYGKIYAVLNIDGVRLFKNRFGDIVKIIYVYCNPDILYQRMLERGDSEENAKKRISHLTEAGELDYISEADYVICTDKNNLNDCKDLIKFIISR